MLHHQSSQIISLRDNAVIFLGVAEVPKWRMSQEGIKFLVPTNFLPGDQHYLFQLDSDWNSQPHDQTLGQYRLVT